MEQQFIHTTINLSTNHAAQLDEAAHRLRIKRTKLVVLLLRKLLIPFKNTKRSYGPVKYQGNDADDLWKKVHVFYEEDEYEVAIDMRKFCKFSVSALVAMAIDMYIEELLTIGKESIKAHFDRYHIHSYQLCRKLHKNSICWHIKWKLSEEFARKFSL